MTIEETTNKAREAYRNSRTKNQQAANHAELEQTPAPSTLKGKALISDWLSTIDSHGIYKAEPMMQDFKASTGYEPEGWPIHTHRDTARAMRNDHRGGQLDEAPADTKEIWGYELAQHLAYQYAKFHTTKMGRGFAHRDCIAGLKAKGF